MFELIRAHQLNIMLLLCGACAILAFLISQTRFLPKSRKRILILMELMALFLLWFDRQAYIYAGDISPTGSIMVRLSNFVVFFLTPGMSLGLTLYIADFMTNEGGMERLPLRLRISAAVSAIGMLLVIIAAFTDLYYYFDETNHYHRGSGFLLGYIIPVVCPVLAFTVVFQYRKIFSRLIFISLILYVFVPVFCGILQIFTYGISIVNMAMVTVSVSMYIFTYLDINNTVEHAHEIELRTMAGENERMKKLFDQTATAFVSAVEKKDDFTKGCAVKTAEYARRIAELAGKDEEECEKVYYAALLHDVGIIGIPDSVIKNEHDPRKWDTEFMKQRPLIGKEILSSITEYPYLSIGAEYSHERYDGTGYPEGLKGEDIPEIARIIAVADAYVSMTTKKRFRDARPDFIAREEFIKGAAAEFDPKFANLMIRIIDQDGGGSDEAPEIVSELSCGEYRDNITAGIPIDGNITGITFSCESTAADGEFSAPSVILFDSYDRRVHDNDRSIEAYRYLEYAEVWFDENSIATAARKIHTDMREKDSTGYEIMMGRYDDHLMLRMTSPGREKELVVALANGVKSAYLALTGEHCVLRDISVRQTGITVKAGDIPRIADEVSFIARMESDIRNVQINRTRSAHTEGIELNKRLKLMFHTMTLPGADLVWHCPYVVIFSSADGSVHGDDYREYALIKFCGENECSEEYAHNSISIRKGPDFPGWDEWKNNNSRGYECEVLLERKGSRIVTRTCNFGVQIENTTEIYEMPEWIYAALTGDQVALTDIRIKR